MKIEHAEKVVADISRQYSILFGIVACVTALGTITAQSVHVM